MGLTSWRSAVPSKRSIRVSLTRKSAVLCCRSRTRLGAIDSIGRAPCAHPGETPRQASPAPKGRPSFTLSTAPWVKALGRALSSSSLAGRPLREMATPATSHYQREKIALPEIASESNVILAPDLRAVTCVILLARGSSNGVRPVRHRVSKPHGLSACLKEAGRREDACPDLYPERVLLKLRAGTCANISTVLEPGLTRAEFIRLAIDEKIAQLRREAGIGVERGVGTVVIGRDQTVGMIRCPDPTNRADDEKKRELLGPPEPPFPVGASL
jgi:hypothetical protein